MSTLEDLEDLEREQNDDRKDDDDQDKKGKRDANKDAVGDADGDQEMKDAEPEEDPIDMEIYSLGTQEINARRRLLENDCRINKSEFQRPTHEKAAMGEKIKDNQDKIDNNR